ncbi:MAG TPA: lytic murein transglycosylase B, partial [Gammaproteobacteria bacterium]|nr:lytic murein transglycosylase B [Gammaproteobacteria bacterium]
VLDALSTLSFEYPPRADFFRKQLIEYLQLTRKEGIDPLSLEGSYAGAIGIPQFIPSSYRVYAVDFNQDGVRDLLNSHEDAIGSVANYFKLHGWEPKQPVVVPTVLKSTLTQEQFDSQLKPTRTLHEIAELGVWVPSDLTLNQMATLMKLDGKNGDEYWIGLQNYYVITRYNHSRLYALAVHILSERIRFEYQNSSQGNI